MKVLVKNEIEKELILQLCDIALKAHGINALNGVNLVKNSIKTEENKKESKEN